MTVPVTEHLRRRLGFMAAAGRDGLRRVREAERGALRRGVRDAHAEAGGTRALAARDVLERDSASPSRSRSGSSGRRAIARCTKPASIGSIPARPARAESPRRARPYAINTRGSAASTGGTPASISYIDADGIEVGAHVDLVRGVGLLRRHVLGRASIIPRDGEVLGAVCSGFSFAMPKSMSFSTGLPPAR